MSLTKISLIYKRPVTMWLFLPLSFMPLILGSSITNGTCYFNTNEEANEIYSPCGNTIDGQWPCCQLGDKCNNFNTCTWDDGSGQFYTYVAGCTDPDYADSSCPYKGNYSNYQWVGLAWDGCKPGGDGNVNWVGCNNNGSEQVTESPESSNCKCNEDEVPLIIAPTGLVAEGFLPTSRMGEISWLPEYSRTDPTAPSTASGASSSTSTVTIGAATTRGSTTTTSSSSSNTDTTMTDGSSDSTAAASSDAQPAPTDGSQQEDIHPGEIAGLAVGGSLIGSAAIGAGIFLLLRRRRIKKQGQTKEQVITIDNNPQDQEKNTPTVPSIPADISPEITHHNSTITSQHSELPGTPADPSYISTALLSPTLPPPKNEYDVYYRPYQYRNPSAEIGLASGSPERMRSGRWQSEYQPYKPSPVVNGSPRYETTAAAASNGQNGNVHELPGCVPDELSSRATSDTGQKSGIDGRAEI